MNWYVIKTEDDVMIFNAYSKREIYEHISVNLNSNDKNMKTLRHIFLDAIASMHYNHDRDDYTPDEIKQFFNELSGDKFEFYRIDNPTFCFHNQ
jgi:septum formation inhibitor-activating ATPase MinD